MASLLRSGSQGDEVRRLQEILNTQGYGLDVDGIFGSNTKNAVKQYQAANGLQADGIVGDQTWGALNALGNAASVTNPKQTAMPTTLTTPRGTSYNPAELTANQADLNSTEGGAPRFQQSQTLSDALNALQAQLGQKPGAYESPYAAQIEALYNKATSRPAFSYDPSMDPLYQMYRDRYAENARRSMQDTLADAAALTGGYGNSYAQAAAQQAYDAQMNGLNDILPQLYGQAWDMYNAEGDRILQQLALAQQMDQTAYGRYADELADYYNQLGARQSLANDMYNREYGQFADALQAWQNDRAYYYGKTADELAQQNYLASLAMSGSSGGSSGGGSSGSRSSSSSRSGGSSGGTTATGANYKTVLATAKGLTNSKAVDYVSRMVDNGYISADEGYRILEVEMGIDTAQYVQPTTQQKDVPIAPLAKNVTLTTALTPVSTTISNAVKTAQDVLSRVLTGAAGNYSKLTGTSSTTANKTPTTTPYAGMLSQAAQDALKKQKK